MIDAPDDRTIENLELFEIYETRKTDTCWKPQNPLGVTIWTESKASLIEAYLRYFVYITKHGTYIDGFAGPQYLDNQELWAAKLVAESEPKRLRHLYLYDIGQRQVESLNSLKASQPNRDIQVYKGNFNFLVHDLLSSQCIKQKEATFCLLDQRTFECHWSTVEALAKYKNKDVNKIELFYFLPNHWLDRALCAQQDTEKLRAWWGRDDWPQLVNMTRFDRLQAFTSRIKDEFGYYSVSPFPIYEKQYKSGHIMYYMIHATDHEEAPKLMHRAYRQAIPSKEQFSLFDTSQYRLN